MLSNHFELLFPNLCLDDPRPRFDWSGEITILGCQFAVCAMALVRIAL